MTLLVPERVVPAYWHVPEYAATIGDEVGGMCADAGFAPYDYQQDAVDVIFARLASGKSAAFEVWLIACRQNIKTAVMKMAALGWMFICRPAEDPIIWTAHQHDPAVREAFVDLRALITGWSWMARQVRYIHEAEHHEEIGLRNGSRIMFRTRTKGAGRSLAGAKTVLDEGWAIKDEHMGSLVPTMAARSMLGDPQILGGSSAARADSDVLHSVVARGRAAASSAKAAALERRLAYIEYCAPPPDVSCERGAKCDHALDTPGCGCDKPDLVRVANPAVGRRISLDFVLTSERRSMPPAEFGRERMGWHDVPAGQVKVIPLTDWADGLDEESEPAGPVGLAVVYSSDKRRAAIGLGGLRADGCWHVEVADVVAAGEEVARVAEIVARAEDTDRPVCAVAVDPHGFEGAAVKGLEDVRSVVVDGAERPVRIIRVKSSSPAWSEGQPPGLVLLTATDVTAAFTGFHTALTETRNLFHRGQDGLTLALMGATARDVGDAGQAWARRAARDAQGRRVPGVDISELVAVTYARYVHEQRAPAVDVEPGAWAI
jgi:hypothetical protein